MPYTAALMKSRPRVDANGDPVPLEPIQGVAARAFSMVESCSFHNRCRHFLPETCDRMRPSLETVSAGQSVRCLRWRDVA
jgi:oligopeptide/dipeptide ABC transporter ATP-binding protein